MVKEQRFSEKVPLKREQWRLKSANILFVVHCSLFTGPYSLSVYYLTGWTGEGTTFK